MKKLDRIIYWIATGLLSALMLLSAGMYIFNHEEIVITFENLGHPGHVIYPLAFLKLSGIIVLIAGKNKTLREWAYAGFFFNFVLAIAAHVNAGDGEFAGGVMALVFLAASYIFDKRRNATIIN